MCKVIINTYHEQPIPRLDEQITVGLVEVDGKMREYYINNSIMNGKGEVFTYSLWYSEPSVVGNSNTNTQREYRNLHTALVDSAQYIMELGKNE